MQLQLSTLMTLLSAVIAYSSKDAHIANTTTFFLAQFKKNLIESTFNTSKESYEKSSKTIPFEVYYQKALLHAAQAYQKYEPVAKQTIYKAGYNTQGKYFVYDPKIQTWILPNNPSVRNKAGAETNSQNLFGELQKEFQIVINQQDSSLKRRSVALKSVALKSEALKSDALYQKHTEGFWKDFGKTKASTHPHPPPRLFTPPTYVKVIFLALAGIGIIYMFTIFFLFIARVLTKSTKSTKSTSDASANRLEIDQNSTNGDFPTGLGSSSSSSLPPTISDPATGYYWFYDPQSGSYYRHDGQGGIVYY